MDPPLEPRGPLTPRKGVKTSCSLKLSCSFTFHCSWQTTAPLTHPKPCHPALTSTSSAAHIPSAPGRDLLDPYPLVVLRIHRAHSGRVQPPLRSPKSPPLPAAELIWAGSNQPTPALSAPNPIVRMFPQHRCREREGGRGRGRWIGTQLKHSVTGDY